MTSTLVPVRGTCWPRAVSATLLLLALVPSARAQVQPPAPAPRWTLEAAEKPLDGAPAVRETVWSVEQPPGGRFDRIGLHRYRGSKPASATLLYLPGTNMNGKAALTDERYNLWVFLAARDIEVFALDYRTRFVPPDTSPADLQVLKDWTSEVFVNDIRVAADFARRESGRERLFVGGFSRGVSLAYAFAGVSPDRVAGLVLLDGYFKHHAPRAAFDYDAERQKLQAKGSWASDVSGRLGWEGRQRLMDAVSANSSAAPFDTKFATIGDQLADLLQSAWGPGALANPRGGLSQPRVLARLLASYDRYYPAIQDLDGRSAADHADDPRTALDDGWGEMRVPLLLFVSSGMGGDWVLNALYSAYKSGASDVRVTLLEGYGHLDVVVGERARQEVFEPVLAWMRDRSR